MTPEQKLIKKLAALTTERKYLYTQGNGTEVYENKYNQLKVGKLIKKAQKLLKNIESNPIEKDHNNK